MAVLNKHGRPLKNNTHTHTRLVVSTHLKNISQICSLPQIGVKIKNIWNHHLDTFIVFHDVFCYFFRMLQHQNPRAKTHKKLPRWKKNTHSRSMDPNGWMDRWRNNQQKEILITPIGILAHRTSEDELLGCPSSPPKCKIFRFHETILRFGEPGSLGNHAGFQ